MLKIWGVLNRWAMMVAGRERSNVSLLDPFFQNLVVFIIIKVELLVSERRYFRVWLKLTFLEVQIRLSMMFPLLHLLKLLYCHGNPDFAVT